MLECNNRFADDGYWLCYISSDSTATLGACPARFYFHFFYFIVRGCLGGLLHAVLSGGGGGELLRSSSNHVSSGIRAMWPNREKRHAWTIVERCGCLVVYLTKVPFVVPFD